MSSSKNPARFANLHQPLTSDWKARRRVAIQKKKEKEGETKDNGAVLSPIVSPLLRSLSPSIPTTYVL